MSDHAPLPPSSADRWVPCPGSIKLEALYPELEETEEQREGTAAHWAVEQVLHGQLVDVGVIAPNGWVLDQDMVDGADLMHGAIPDRLRPIALVESRVSMSQRIHPENWGTPDAWAYDVAARTIYLWDYKYGHGFVDVFENLQLIDYAAGIVQTLGIDGLGETEHRIVFCIVQPRCWHRDGHVRRWTCRISDLRTHWNRLEMSASVAMQENPPVNPGVDGAHCKNCLARHACPALHKDVAGIATNFEIAVPLELSDNALGFEIRQLRRLKAKLEGRLTGLEGDATVRMRQQGKRIPGLGMESKPGRLNWTVPSDTVIALGQLYGLQLGKPPEPITPTQAIEKGLPPEMVLQAAKREPTASKLVLTDAAEMRRIFTAQPY